VNDSQAMAELKELGQFRVPVVRSGDRVIYAGNLDDVAGFLGIAPTGHCMLPPERLFEKYDAVLEAVQRYLRAFPPDRIRMTVPRREKRDMRQLGYHVFAIAEDLMRVRDGDEYTQGNWPVPERIRSFDDIVAYGDEIRGKLRAWQATKNPESWTEVRKTKLYGDFPMHFYLERATWHSGQHSRQIVEMFNLAGLAAPDPLPESFFEGLPMPQRIWE
jgi:hypothetical protein